MSEFPFVAEKLTVIPDCVSDAFTPRPRLFNRDCPRILQVGTARHKNLEAVAKAEAGLPCILHILGRLSGAQVRLLEGLNIRYENGADLPDGALLRAYEEADMVVFASSAEGFGLPIIEANAVGRPVVTSDLPPMNEVAGDAGCLVDPCDVMGIRDGILRVIADDEYRNALVERGYENARRHRAPAVASQYARLYEQLAGYRPIGGEAAVDRRRNPDGGVAARRRGERTGTGQQEESKLEGVVSMTILQLCLGYPPAVQTGGAGLSASAISALCIAGGNSVTVLTPKLRGTQYARPLTETERTSERGIAVFQCGT